MKMKNNLRIFYWNSAKSKPCDDTKCKREWKKVYTLIWSRRQLSKEKLLVLLQGDLGQVGQKRKYDEKDLERQQCSDKMRLFHCESLQYLGTGENHRSASIAERRCGAQGQPLIVLNNSHGLQTAVRRGGKHCLCSQIHPHFCSSC